MKLIVLWIVGIDGLQYVSRSRVVLNARPKDCPKEIWNQIVDAELKSREKKFGAVGAALGSAGLDKGAIEANQLRIWEELKKRKDSPEPISQKEEDSNQGPFASLRNAWQKMYEEADRQGYAQAVALSANLENKGLLPKVVTADKQDTEKALLPSTSKSKKRRKKTRSGAKQSSKKGFAKSST